MVITIVSSSARCFSVRNICTSWTSWALELLCTAQAVYKQMPYLAILGAQGLSRQTTGCSTSCLNLSACPALINEASPDSWKTFINVAHGCFRTSPADRWVGPRVGEEHPGHGEVAHLAGPGDGRHGGRGVPVVDVGEVAGQQLSVKGTQRH